MCANDARNRCSIIKILAFGGKLNRSALGPSRAITNANRMHAQSFERTHLHVRTPIPFRDRRVYRGVESNISKYCTVCSACNHTIHLYKYACATCITYDTTKIIRKNTATICAQSYAQLAIILRCVVHTTKEQCFAASFLWPIKYISYLDMHA